MNRAEARKVLHNALTGYVEDCAGADTPEANEIQEAWETIEEINLTPDEESHMRTVLDHLDIDSELYDTQMKIMRAIGIVI